MSVKYFLDGANYEQMVDCYKNNPKVKGFTTNPTLMRAAGISNYEEFAKKVLATISDLPISFEVFSDDLNEMEVQAEKIATWGNNVNVKIPVTNTKGQSTAPIIQRLSNKGISLNVTAIFTVEQVKHVVEALAKDTPSIISIFGGRIANAGVDPMPIMKESVAIAKVNPKCEVLWASPREAFNCIQADECGCHIITITQDILKATSSFGKDLTQFSLETVQMFYNDAQKAGFSL
ncbi:MAG: transaldolase [Deltaproteobacteria bacterium CG11_big_fil_rev_8_21_14_0_20_47_16]|nr:MAG: transaldolase [Deltaproteobacteria bacterium CG11_big_fil_rev_8_21_14_0_20_47_16]